MTRHTPTPRTTAATAPGDPVGTVGMLPRLGDVLPHWARRQSRLRERTPRPVQCATCLDTGFVLPAKLTQEYCSCERGKAAWQEELQQYQEMQTVLAENYVGYPPLR